MPRIEPRPCPDTSVAALRARGIHPVLARVFAARGCISALALSAQTGDSLKFFKNYFITGDYAVGGVNLRGTGVNGYATGGITISDVSPNADILGAFLYWEAVEKGAEPRTGVRSARFNGADLTSIGKQVGSGAPPCWSTGGATGPSNGAHRLVVYRADVLGFIPIDSATGKRLVNTSHSVKVPDSGTGNSLPVAVGASLVVIYRQ